MSVFKIELKLSILCQLIKVVASFLLRQSYILMAKHKLLISMIFSACLHVTIALLFILNRPILSGGAGMEGNERDGVRFNVNFASMPIDSRLFTVVAPETSEASEAIIPPSEIAAIDTNPVRDMLTYQAPQLSELASPEITETNDQLAKGNDGQDGKTNEDLWTAIAPCWNRIADNNTQGVILEVSFSANGGLSKPPVIVRHNNSDIDSQKLQSESKALSALAECGAYTMVKGQENVKVTFPGLH